MYTNAEKPRIGIIGAMKPEIDAVKNAIEKPMIETVSGIEFVRGELNGVQVVAAKCGVGKVFAAMCTQIMLMKYDPETVINIGVGGSLTKNLNIGDIAIADALCQHDMDTSAVGDPVGMVSGVDMIRFPCDNSLVKRFQVCAERLGLHYETGLVASGDVFVSDSIRKKFIVDTFGAISCEMEGAAIAQVCFVNAVDFAVIRAISDNGDEDSGRDYGNALERASNASIQMLFEYLKLCEDE